MKKLVRLHKINYRLAIETDALIKYMLDASESLTQLITSTNHLLITLQLLDRSSEKKSDTYRIIVFILNIIDTIHQLQKTAQSLLPTCRSTIIESDIHEASHFVPLEQSGRR